MRRRTALEITAVGLVLAAAAAAAITMFGAAGNIPRATAAAAAASTVHGPASHVRHAADGIIIGRFERVGGPLGPGGTQPPVVPLSGTIRFARAGHRAVSVHAGKSGRFSARLAPGSYRVWGRTPDIRGEPGDVDAICPLPGKVKVTADRTRHIAVYCVVP